MKLTPQQIGLIVEYFRPQPIFAVYLFGSYARGDADDESDIDLVLEVDFEAGVSPRPIRYRRELGALLSLKVDIYLAHKMLKYVKESVWKERLLLYRR
jgi:predicted nucleotidyltransferase